MIFSCIIFTLKGMNCEESYPKEGEDYTITPFSDEYTVQETSPKDKLTIKERRYPDPTYIQDIIKDIRYPQRIGAVINDRGCYYGYSDINNVDLKALSRFYQLTHLVLDDLHWIENFEDLESLKSLTVLVCKNNHGLKSVYGLNELPLKKVVLSRCSQLETLNQLPSTIEHLEISHAKIESLCDMRDWENLRMLIVTKTKLSEVSDSDLPENIEYLDLSYNKLKDIGFVYKLMQCRTIKLNGSAKRMNMPLSILDLIKAGKVEEFDLTDIDVPIEDLKMFIVDFFNTNDYKQYSKHPLVRSIKKLLADYMEYDEIKLIEKRNKLDQKLLKLKETKRECFGDDENK